VPIAGGQPARSHSFPADAHSGHSITLTNDMLNTHKLVGNALADDALDTLKMFYENARKARYTL
jgi:hypothetical protein